MELQDFLIQNKVIISVIISIIVIFFGKDWFIRIYKSLKKPKLSLASEIEKDIEEYLFTIRFKIKNLSIKEVTLSKNINLKLHSVKPEKINTAIKSVISYSQLEGKKSKKIKNDSLKLKTIRNTTEPTIDKKETELIISGLTTDTKSLYNLSLQLISKNKIFGLFRWYKTKYFNFDYEGETPPGILIIGKNKKIVNKLFYQVNNYLNSEKSGLTNFFSIIKMVHEKAVKGEKKWIEKIGVNRKVDYILLVEDQIEIQNGKNILKIEFSSYAISDLTENYLFNFKLFDQSNYKFDENELNKINFEFSKETFLPVKLFLNSIILEISMKSGKTGTVYNQTIKLYNYFNYTPVILLLGDYLWFSKKFNYSEIVYTKVYEYLKNYINGEKEYLWFDLNNKIIKLSNFKNLNFDLQNRIRIHFYFAENRYLSALLSKECDYKTIFKLLCKMTLNNSSLIVDNYKVRSASLLNLLWHKYIFGNSHPYRQFDRKVLNYIASEYLRGANPKEIKKSIGIYPDNLGIDFFNIDHKQLVIGWFHKDAEKVLNNFKNYYYEQIPIRLNTTANNV